MQTQYIIVPTSTAQLFQQTLYLIEIDRNNLAMADLQNANPTVLDVSDLPSRARPSQSTATSGVPGSGLHGQSSLFRRLDSPPELFLDPFAANFSSTKGNDSESETDSIDNDDNAVEVIDEQEIYDLISTISDPEHPLSLGELAVVNLPHITIKSHSPTEGSKPSYSTVEVGVTPTVNHCSLATVIGLGIRVRLEQSLPPRYRIDVRIREGTHATADQVNKQLNDKERVAAAMENSTLMAVLTKMLETCK
jgi:metal-sulfur cluster biosynthetic enzyme